MTPGTLKSRAGTLNYLTASYQHDTAKVLRLKNAIVQVVFSDITAIQPTERRCCALILKELRASLCSKQRGSEGGGD